MNDFLFSSARQADAFCFIHDRYRLTGRCTPVSDVAKHYKIGTPSATKMLRDLEAVRKLVTRPWKGCYQPVLPIPPEVVQLLNNRGSE